VWNEVDTAPENVYGSMDPFNIDSGVGILNRTPSCFLVLVVVDMLPKLKHTIVGKKIRL
jgi:hypothetical protein